MVPASANTATGILKSKPYGAKTIEIIEKTHIEIRDIVFARNDMAPVFRKVFTWGPNSLLSTTKLYSRSDDLTKNVAARISQMVPGNPGIMYPTIPSPRHMRPSITNNRFLSFLTSKGVTPVNRCPKKLFRDDGKWDWKGSYIIG